MNDRLADMIRFKMMRSDATFEEARVLSEIESWNGVINRLYYAAFYAVSSLLLKEGVQVKTHTTVKSRFNELYIRSARLKREFGNTYNVLFNYRNEGDYDDFLLFTEEDVQPLIANTEKLINEIKKLI